MDMDRFAVPVDHADYNEATGDTARSKAGNYYPALISPSYSPNSQASNSFSGSQQTFDPLDFSNYHDPNTHPPQWNMPILNQYGIHAATTQAPQVNYGYQSTPMIRDGAIARPLLQRPSLRILKPKPSSGHNGASRLLTPDSNGASPGFEPNSPRITYPKEAELRQSGGYSRRHRSTLQSTDSFVCPHPRCGRKCKRLADLRRHFRVHDDAYHSTLCEKCNRKFTRVDKYRDHLKACHHMEKGKVYMRVPRIRNTST